MLTTPLSPPTADLDILHIAGDLTADAGPQNAAGDVMIDGRICAGASLAAGGDVEVAGSVQSAHIVCCGELRVKNGAIVGGEVWAGAGIISRMVGHRVKAPTRLMLGFDQKDLDSAAQRISAIDTLLGKSEEIRKQVDRLNHAHLALTAEHKERMTELLFSAAAAEKRARAAIEQLRKHLSPASATANAACTCIEMLFSDVEIYYPGVRACIEEPIKGPLRIFAERTEKGTRIVALHLPTNKATALKTVAHPGRAGELLAQLDILEKRACH